MDKPTSAVTAPTAPGAYRRLAGNVFAEQPHNVPTRAVGRNVLLGRDTWIDPSAEVHNSVLGRGCRVGAGAKVYDSCLWNGVVVKEHCTVFGSLLADGVVLEAGRCC